MKLDFKKVVDALKSEAPSFLEVAKVGFVCPECGNGSGESGTGITLNPKGKGYKCFKCGLTADTFDLWKLANKNISDMEELLEGAVDYFKLDAGSLSFIPGEHKTSPKPAQKQPTAEAKAEPRDYSKFFSYATQELHKTDYLEARGIRNESYIKAFSLGYKESFTGYAGKVWNGALIIPTSKNSYVARNTDLQAPKDQRYKKLGASRLFYLGSYQGKTIKDFYEAIQGDKPPVFVVEGELDALSVYEAGGYAVALGSTSNKDIFLKEVGFLNGKNQALILSLDNDEEGKRTSIYLAEKLKEMGISFLILNPWGSDKDANAFLMKNREALVKNVSSWANLPRLSPKDLSPASEEEKASYLRGSNQNFLEALISSTEEMVEPIPTGFKIFDELLEGGLYPGLYTLGAPPASGKTAFCLQLADQLAQAGNDVLYFSLEMSREELMVRSISRLTFLRGKEKHLRGVAKTERQITNRKFREAFTTEENVHLSECVASYANFSKNIYVVEGMGDFGTEKVRETIEKHIRCTGKKPIVFIDYFQILQPIDTKASEKVNADKNIVELKRISREFRLPVFNISSFSRANYSKGEDTDMSAFKESGGIEYTNDMALALYRPKKEGSLDPEKNVVLSVLKNRHGTDEARISFNYVRAYHYLEEEERLPDYGF